MAKWREVEGMTLRDYFAGQTLANPDICDSGGRYISCDVKSAYEYADAMLEARK